MFVRKLVSPQDNLYKKLKVKLYFHWFLIAATLITLDKNSRTGDTLHLGVSNTTVYQNIAVLTDHRSCLTRIILHYTYFEMQLIRTLIEKKKCN